MLGINKFKQWARALTLALLMAPSPAMATATIITNSDDVATRFETQAQKKIQTKKLKPPSLDESELVAQPLACSPTAEGRTRYNGAPEVKGIEFCDGTRWVGLLKTAPVGDAAPLASCTQGEESLVRYNKHKTAKTYEFCDGTTWHKMGAGGLPISSHVFDKPFMHNLRTPTVLTEGLFREDGYLGAYLSCNGGSNHFSLYLTIGFDKSPGANPDKIVSATAQNNRIPSNDIDQASLFSYVPKNMPWKIWVRDNNSDGLLNKTNCLVKVTKFGA